MASKKEKAQPAFIDYSESDVSNSAETWSTTQFGEYWRQLAVKHHRAALAPFTIKEKTLLKRLVDAYEAEDLKKMMEEHITKFKYELAISLPLFFSRRHRVYDKIKPKDYGWE